MDTSKPAPKSPHLTVWDIVLDFPWWLLISILKFIFIRVPKKLVKILSNFERLKQILRYVVKTVLAAACTVMMFILMFLFVPELWKSWLRSMKGKFFSICHMIFSNCWEFIKDYFPYVWMGLVIYGLILGFISYRKHLLQKDAAGEIDM